MEFPRALSYKRNLWVACVLAVALLVGLPAWANPTEGLANPWVVQGSMTNATMASSGLLDDAGNEAWAFVLATDSSSGLELRIRLCRRYLFPCADYAQSITPGKTIPGSQLTEEYTITQGSVGVIRTVVAGLGLVSLRVYSVDDAGPSISCDGPYALAAGSFAGNASQAFANYGGSIGPWKVVVGTCGANGRNTFVLAAAA